MSTSPAMTDMEPEQGEFAADLNPDQIQDEESVFTYGENNRDLPDQLKDALSALVKKFQLRDMYDRRIEVLGDRILRFYDDGIQHVYPNYGTGVYQIGVSGGYVDLGNGDGFECPEYMGAYNIFRSRRRSLDAVITQNPPGPAFEPDNPAVGEDIEAAETAEAYRHFFDQANDVRQIDQEMARMFELSGRCVTVVQTVADKQKWGVGEDGQPRSMETVRVYGTLETKVPILCNRFADMLYCFVYDDKDYLMLKAENEHIRTKIEPGQAGLGENDWERFARLGVKQSRKGYYLTGSALAHITTQMGVFLRPGAFEDACCDDVFTQWAEDEEPRTGEDERPWTIRDELRRIFPEGVRAVYIGGTYSEAWNCSMDDAVDIGFPCQRDGMTGGALMEPMKVIQDTFNDYMNAKREYYEKGWPRTYFKGGSNDYDAISSTRCAPAQFQLLKESAPDADIEGQIVYQEPAMQVPQSFDESIEELRGVLSQDITGALPALQGQSKPDQTASGQAMDRSQAMGMLGPAYENKTKMWCGIYYKAALLAAKNPDHQKEIVVVKGDGSNAVVRLESLTKGKFHCHPDEDAAFPESIAAKRAQLDKVVTLATQNPAIGQMLFMSPDNWEVLLALEGFPELNLIPATAFKKQTRELEVLLREAPVDNSAAVEQAQVEHAALALQAMQQGLPVPPFQPPPPMMPSLVPEKDDFHQWESMKCAEWLSSEDCWRRTESKDEQVLKGIQNVRLHKAIHDQFLAQQAAQQVAMQPPPAPHKPPPASHGAPEAHPQAQKNAAPPGGGGATL